VRGLARAWRKAIKSSPSGAAISGWALASFPTAPTSRSVTITKYSRVCCGASRLVRVRNSETHARTERTYFRKLTKTNTK